MKFIEKLQGRLAAYAAANQGDNRIARLGLDGDQDAAAINIFVDLCHRLAVRHDGELGDVGDTLSDLLARAQALQAYEWEFVGDAMLAAKREKAAA